MDRFVAYVSLFDESFPGRIRPIDPKVLAEFEELYDAPLPAEFRAYLERMGGDAGGFQIFNDDETPLWALMAFYRAKDRDFEPPRDGSILIARSTDVHLALDGRTPPARPVAMWDFYEYTYQAESLEKHLLQRAWWQYAGKDLSSTAWPDLGGGEPVFQRAREAAIRRGLRVLDFSERSAAFFEGHGQGLYLDFRETGEVGLHARASTPVHATELAREIAAESGGRPI